MGDFSIVLWANLIDNLSLGSKDSPGALHSKLGALAISASSREFLSASSDLNWQLSPGQRLEVVRREPTRNLRRMGTQRSASNHFDESPCSLSSLRRDHAECAQNLWTCKIKYPLEEQRTLPNSHMRRKQMCDLNSG